MLLRVTKTPKTTRDHSEKAELNVGSFNRASAFSEVFCKNLISKRELEGIFQQQNIFEK